MPRLVTRILLGVAAALVTFAAHARIPPSAPTLEREAVTEESPPAALLRLATLGFEALVADYHWLQTIQTIGHEQGDAVADAPRVRRRIERVVALDPFVDHAYRFASVWLINDPEQVRAGNRILERGIAYHPLDWRNRFYLSFNHFFYLGDAVAAARELEPAVTMEGAPRYLGRLLARLRSQQGGLEVAGAYLGELLRQTDDPWKRAEYEKALDEIETERRARLLDDARAAFVERHGRDIERIEDLVRGRDAVLATLPPEPHGWEWEIDAQSGRIQSTYLKSRYRLHMHERDRQRLEAWQQQAPSEARADAAAGEGR